MEHPSGEANGGSNPGARGMLPNELPVVPWGRFDLFARQLNRDLVC